jgi:hypothetical protein
MKEIGVKVKIVKPRMIATDIGGRHLILLSQYYSLKIDILILEHHLSRSLAKNMTEV